jgi:hypothetical protein
MHCYRPVWIDEPTVRQLTGVPCRTGVNAGSVPVLRVLLPVYLWLRLEVDARGVGSRPGTGGADKKE